MKKSILAIVFITLTAVSCKNNKNKVATNEEVKTVKEVENVINSYKANVTKSIITWKGSKPTGSHDGIINLKSGVFNIENGIIKAGEFVVDMNSISCNDLEAGKGKEKLEKHLKNSDFFDVEKFPIAKFQIASSEIKGSQLHITGNLTIKDITKSITIPVTVTEKEGFTSLKSDAFSIDRTEFGVTYSSKKFSSALKDKFINDLMEMSFEIIAKN